MNDESTSLFREVVLNRESPGWLGPIKLARPLSLQIWSLASAFIGLTLIGWLYFGEYTRRERVDGYLAPRSGMAKVQSRASGTITRVLVSEGDVVRRGQSLIEIDGDTYTGDPSGLSKSIDSSLQSQYESISDEIDALRKLHGFERAERLKKASLLRQQIEWNASEASINELEARSQQEHLERIQPAIDSAYIAPAEVSRLRTSLSSVKATVSRLNGQRYALRAQLEELESEIAKSPLNNSSSLSALARDQARLAADQYRNLGNTTSVARAPIDGVVSVLHIYPGQAVSPGHPMLSIAPLSSQLEAELLVPSNAIGFVKPGDKVALRYASYAYQKFGSQLGTVKTVSKTPISPVDLNSLIGTQFTAPMYKIRVEIPSEAMRIYGKERKLLAGTGIDADIMLERRKLYEFIFEPAFAIKQKAAVDR